MGWRYELERRALVLYGKLPEPVRRRLVRLVAPSFTVGALCVIHRPDGQLLLVRQVYRPKWGLPGGLMQRGEEPAEAARREVEEEVNLAIELLGEPQVVVDPGPQLIDIAYLARPVSLEAVREMRPTSPETAEARWFRSDELPELQRETAAALAAIDGLERPTWRNSPSH